MTNQEKSHDKNIPTSPNDMDETKTEVISSQAQPLAEKQFLLVSSKQRFSGVSIDFKVDSFFLTHPVISTFFTAMMLASMWVLVWLAVLFFLTFATKASVTPSVLVSGLLLSTIAEGFIRAAESSPRLRRYSSGNLKRDISTFNVSTALVYLFGGILLVMLLPISEWNNHEFNLTAPNGNGTIVAMFLQWYDVFSNSKYLALGLIWCWLLRVLIYKKPHHTYDWNETKEFVEKLNAEEGNAEK